MAPEYEKLMKKKKNKVNLNFEKCDVYSLGATLI
jgi:hypothetical protein